MKKRIFSWFKVFLLPALLTLVLAGCKGGGGGGGSSSSSGSVTGLEISERLSVVEDSGGTGGGLSVRGLSIAARLPANTSSAYYTDEVDKWIYDASTESLSIVNEILCAFAQTGYKEMVNQGNYIALVDWGGCEQGSNQSSTGSKGQSSGAGGDDLEIWTVHSSRADNNSPHIITVWVNEVAEEDFDEDKIIYVKVTITEGSGTSNPYGMFSMTFKGLPPTASHDASNPIFTGSLKTVDSLNNQLGFAFYMTMGNMDTAKSPGEFAMIEKAHVNTSADLSTGQAYTYSKERFNWGGGDSTNENEYDVAFDGDYFRRSIDGGQTNECFDRNNFSSMVWRYGLYNSSTGARITRDSGFGIKTAGGDFAWIGYWGLWAPPGVTINSGDMVTRDDYGSGTTGDTYTVVRAPGKLIKHTKIEKTLGDIKGNPLNYWDIDTNFQVFWDGTKFEKRFSWNNSTESWDAITPVTLSFNPNDWVGFWSDALGGDVSFIYPGTGSPDDSTPIILYEQEFVTAPASNLTLYCYYECLKANITQAQADWNGDAPILPESNDVNTPYQYTFVKDTLTLQYGGQDVKLANGVEPGQTSPNQWGFHSGAMVTDTTGFTGPWEVWEQNIFYTWETGHNEWNQYAGLKDSLAQFVVFDPPLHITYTHSTANDANGDSTYNGRIYQLEYSGLGELHGIPFVDSDGDDRWYPEFSIKDGTTMGDSNEYIVKAIEMEGFMQSVNDTNCSGAGLNTTTGLSAPSNDYVDPAIGAKPTVTDPPAVIKGELQ